MGLIFKFPPLTFASHNILRAYQLLPDAELDESCTVSLKDLVCPEVLSDIAYFSSKYDRMRTRFLVNNRSYSNVDALRKLKRRFSVRFSSNDSHMGPAPKVRMPVEIRSCKEYLARMSEIRLECEKRGLMPVYYQILPAAAETIAKKGFRYSFQSVKDVGIYFTTRSPASYDLGCTEYEEYLALDMLNLDSVQNVRGSHKFDACFVYAAEARVLRQAPGSRGSSVMVPQVFLEILSEPEPRTRDFLLRPDRIVACFLLDPAKPPADYDNNVDDMKAEKEIDEMLTRKLAKVKTVARCNESITQGEHGLGVDQTPWPRMDMVSKGFGNGQHKFGENDIDPMIFGDGDFGVHDWATLLVDIDGAGGVKKRDLPQLLSFRDDQDPYTLVGLNVHLKVLEMKALNNWTGVVKAWKSGDGKEKRSVVVRWAGHLVFSAC